MNKLVKVLDSRLTGTFSTFFAIANRIIFTTLYSQIGADTKLQLTYAENLMNGKGMGVTKYFTSNINIPFFDTQQGFPPGFSFIIIPFLKLFNGNEHNAVMAFDMIVAVLFILLVRLAGKRAGLPNSLNNILIVIAGCTQYLFFTSWSSTEAVCICLLLFSIIQTINIIEKKDTIGVLKATGYGVLFFLPFLFRYIYLPISITFPLFIILSGFLLKNKSLKFGGLKILIATVFFLMLQFSYGWITAGNALYVIDVGRGLFINQLALSYPFMPACFINIDFGAQLIQNIFGIDYSSVMRYLEILNLVMVVLFLGLVCRYFQKNKIKLFTSSHSLFLSLGSLICVIILALLTYLTVTYKEFTWGFYRWAHVIEARYFSFLYIFIPITLIICVHRYRSFFQRRLPLLFTCILFICLATEVLHGIYYNFKIIINHPSLGYMRDADKGFRDFPGFLEEVKNKNPGRDIIVCSPDKYYLYTASQLGYKAIFDYTNFLQTGLKISSKSVLVMPIQPQDVVIIKDYIDKNNPALVYSVASASFYIQIIDPEN